MVRFAVGFLTMSLMFVAYSQGQDNGVQAYGALTWPVSGQSGVNAWFDHHSPGSTSSDLPFARYDGYADFSSSALCTSATTCNCTIAVNCYNGHVGIDVNTGGVTGRPVIAAATGIVVGPPGDVGDGLGRTVRLWHAGTGLATTYSHLDNWVVQENQTVTRGQYLGYSGCSGSGCYIQPHLHFGVYNAQTGGNPIDPYGWSGPGADPWGHDRGYLWTTNPPSQALGAAADRAVWRPATATWWIDYYVGEWTAIPWGQNGDTPVPADYTGDKKTDPAIFRTVGAVKKWWIYNGEYDQQWGDVGDIAVPCDYTADGKADLAVFRTMGNFTSWFIRGWPVFEVKWGEVGDIPVPADYTGDGRCDIAVWRPSNGWWYVFNGPQQQWGQSGDRPVPADFTCDGRADYTVYRPSGGPPNYPAYWWVHGFPTSQQWGSNTDIALPRDYNGSCYAKYGVWRSSNATWYVYGLYNVPWGNYSDYAVPADYDGR